MILNLSLTCPTRKGTFSKLTRPWFDIDDDGISRCIRLWFLFSVEGGTKVSSTWFHNGEEVFSTHYCPCDPSLRYTMWCYHCGLWMVLSQLFTSTLSPLISYDFVVKQVAWWYYIISWCTWCFDDLFQIMVYEAVVAGHSPVFFSLSGDGAAIQSGDTVTVNGLYAEKLGIRDKQEVPLWQCLCWVLLVTDGHGQNHIHGKAHADNLNVSLCVRY